MPEHRIESEFNDKDITSERLALREKLDNNLLFPEVRSLAGEAAFRNLLSERKLGKYRPAEARKSVTADWDVIEECIGKKMSIPSFREAGPRELLFHSPYKVRAAIVTTGGLAPGLNCVIHSIVDRHWNTYKVSKAQDGGIFGIYESFLGACDLDQHMKHLSPEETEKWLDKGGCMLGIRRFHIRGGPERLAKRIKKQLDLKKIDILYVIGGDGTLKVAHEIAKIADKVSVVGIPKTMDNDVMWVWQSFGFRTAVQKAAEVINTLNAEAEATRRVCLIELFGAESGFVAANATLASGHVDLVLIPEEFQPLTKKASEKALTKYINYLKKRVQNPRGNEKPHAVVVLAEGVAKILSQRGIKLGNTLINKEKFLEQLKDYLNPKGKPGKIKDGAGRSVDVFYNRPRHNIRAIPANAQDQIYCERLGALAVDNALAGYTDFMISQWLTEYVLVPLELVAGRHKRIPPAGIFWKQVVRSTGQPSISPEEFP